MRPAAQPQGLNCRVCPCVEECLCCKQWKCLFNLCSLQGIPGLNVNKNGNTGKHTKPSDTQTNVAGRHCSCFRASPYIDLSCYTCGFGFADRLLAVGEPQKTSIFAGTTTNHQKILLQSCRGKVEKNMQGGGVGEVQPGVQKSVSISSNWIHMASWGWVRDGPAETQGPASRPGSITFCTSCDGAWFEACSS